MIDNGIIVHNTLNTKHGASGRSKTVTTAGVPRIEELLHYSKDIKTPQMKVYFNDDIAGNKNKVNKIASYLKFFVFVSLKDDLLVLLLNLSCFLKGLFFILKCIITC